MLSQITNAAKLAATAANTAMTSLSKKTVDGHHVHPHGKPEGKEKPSFQADELVLRKKPQGQLNEKPGCKPAGKPEANDFDMDRFDGAINEKPGSEKPGEKGLGGKPGLKDELEAKHGKLFQPMQNDAQPVGQPVEGKGDEEPAGAGKKQADKPGAETKPSWKGKIK